MSQSENITEIIEKSIKGEIAGCNQDAKKLMKLSTDIGKLIEARAKEESMIGEWELRKPKIIGLGIGIFVEYVFIIFMCSNDLYLKICTLVLIFTNIFFIINFWKILTQKFAWYIVSIFILIYLMLIVGILYICCTLTTSLIQKYCGVCLLKLSQWIDQMVSHIL